MSGRQGHDATGFYKRFPAPVLSKDTTINPCPDTVTGRVHVGDSRDMSIIPDNSVALVVTSPPYYAGKAYETAVGQGHVPADYIDYLAMLRDVFAECVRTLEPGGRMCINVANLGRKPYRSLSKDVWNILEVDLGLLARGEIVWVKAKGASGAATWGSWMRPSNPVLRDLTERILVVSKGRFDRALTPKQRAAKGLPHRGTIERDAFMRDTLDTWFFQPASATRIGHPAPYPVELPHRCIQMHTYENDVVLDPFMGSGTTAVAAVQDGRRWIGFDTDPAYAELALRRVADAATAGDHAEPKRPKKPAKKSAAKRPAAKKATTKKAPRR